MRDTTVAYADGGTYRNGSLQPIIGLKPGTTTVSARCRDLGPVSATLAVTRNPVTYLLGPDSIRLNPGMQVGADRFVAYDSDSVLVSCRGCQYVIAYPSVDTLGGASNTVITAVSNGLTSLTVSID